jgi:hypothetical protein
MSWETIERYEPCKCGNLKGLKTSREEDDWGQNKEGPSEIVCKKCKAEYYLTEKRAYSNDGDSWIAIIWNKKSNK